MEELREAPREFAPNPGISIFSELADGAILEGVVKDVSDGGAKISGDTTGISCGDEIRLVLVVQGDQRVVYRCEVRHVEVEERYYGVIFKTPPQLLDGAKITSKYCTRCRRRFTSEWKFCGECGLELKFE